MAFSLRLYTSSKWLPIFDHTPWFEEIKFVTFRWNNNSTLIFPRWRRMLLDYIVAERSIIIVDQHRGALPIIPFNSHECSIELHWSTISWYSHVGSRLVCTVQLPLHSICSYLWSSQPNLQSSFEEFSANQWSSTQKMSINFT